MSTLALKNVKIQDPTGTQVSTLSYDGTNITIDKPIVATAPTAAPGTSTAQLATTAFAYGTLSAGGNGYQMLPSGLIIQWGVAGPCEAPATFSGNFPIAFPNACFVVNFQSENGVATSLVSCSFTKTGFSGYKDEWTGVTNNGYIYFIAIGN